MTVSTGGTGPPARCPLSSGPSSARDAGKRCCGLADKAVISIRPG